jgi:hypothetical protein
LNKSTKITCLPASIRFWTAMMAWSRRQADLLGRLLVVEAAHAMAGGGRPQLHRLRLRGCLGFGGGRAAAVTAISSHRRSSSSMMSPPTSIDGLAPG